MAGLPNWPFSDIIREVGETVRQVAPNPRAQLDHNLRLEELSQQLNMAQVGVNREEARSSNLFVAGWRPFIGWTGGIALAYLFVLGPIVQQVFGVNVPDIETDDLFMIILAMLGIGGMRTWEKLNGVATSVGGRVLRPVGRELPQDLDGLV